MKNSMKCLSIIMVMIIMILTACAQGNTADNNSTNTQTGVVGKWKTSSGFIVEFKNAQIYLEDGSSYGEYIGNDVEGELIAGKGTYSSYTYVINGNSMTWTNKNNGDKQYYTRI
ncbi:MAG: hypothetical protein IKQ61_13740 [Spirochaetales bacterium]|nr:hypothetical protein [Spirochaetales bacterium]MBR6201316.1 hypothetical protein [Spirochaetales bacterium]